MPGPDNRIANLQVEAAQGSAQAQREAAKQVKQLRRLRERAQVQLERVASATPAVWNEMKTGISSALEDLGNAQAAPPLIFARSAQP